MGVQRDMPYGTSSLEQLTPRAGVEGEGSVFFLVVLAPLGHGAPEEQPLCSCSAQDSRREGSLYGVGGCAAPGL